jgi:uncharacterized protein (TIGR02452 family)
MNRLQLIAVYNDTKKKCINGKYSKLKINDSIKYTKQDLTSMEMKKKYDKTIIEVINEDTLVACELLVKEDKQICALNMGSCFNPGGGVKKGCTAQEEELFRRTNYFLTLKDDFYDLIGGDCIYSPTIHVIKNKNYEDIDVPFSVSFIAAAAVRKPKTIMDKKDRIYANDADRESMDDTIDAIFKVPYINNKTTLVLSALGCGAYGNPQKEVINIFNKYIKKYDGCFRKIVFAIYSVKDNNYELFKNGLIK